MSKVKKVKEALRKQMERARPLMDQDKTRQTLLDWLAQLNFPNIQGKNSWHECVHEFPAEPGDNELDEGVRVRFGFKLHTLENSYLLSLMELLDVSSREVYILTVHVNWKETEKKMQQAVEQRYTGAFDDIFRSRHVIWAQTYRPTELVDALNSAAMAILSNELTAGPVKGEIGTPIKHPLPVRLDLPEDSKPGKIKSEEELV